MTITQQQEDQSQTCLQSSLSSSELAQAKQFAKQAVRNLQPGSASASPPPTNSSLPPIRQPSLTYNTSIGNYPTAMNNSTNQQIHLYQQQRMMQQLQQQYQQQEAGMIGNSSVLVNGIATPRSRLFGGVASPVLPIPGASNHLRTKSDDVLRKPSSPSNSFHHPFPIPHHPQMVSSPTPTHNALLQQQILNNELYQNNYLGGGIARANSNPQLMNNVMNGLVAARKSPDNSRNGHSQKMTHSYANGKSSPVGGRSANMGVGVGMLGNRPPIYPNGHVVHASGAQVVPPTLRSVASLNGSLSARMHYSRSSAGSLNLSMEDGDEGSVGYGMGGGAVRHARNNSTPGQLDALAADYRTNIALQQHIRAGSGAAEQFQQMQQQRLLMEIGLQQKQLMQQLQPTNGVNDIYNQLIAKEASLAIDPTTLAQSTGLLSHHALHNNTTQQANQRTPSNDQLSAVPYVPEKLEVYAQLLGGSEVAEQNLAAIPELEAQIFSVVADLLYAIMLGESVKDVRESIRAIAQFTRNEKAQLHAPMPQAFASWLRRVALVMPLISAVYQEKSQRHAVREGFATLIRIYAEGYPKLGSQLETLMGMGEAAAACMLDSTNLWRQVVALLENKESKLKQMESEPLQDSLDGWCGTNVPTRASTGSDGSVVQMDPAHKHIDSVCDYQECDSAAGNSWADVVKS